jgi:hypothetical protein
MRTAGGIVSTTRSAPRRPAARDPHKRPRESPRARRVRARPQGRRRLAARRRRSPAPAQIQPTCPGTPHVPGGANNRNRTASRRAGPQNARRVSLLVSHCRTKASIRLRVRALIGTPPHRTVVERQHSFNTGFVGRLGVGRSSRPSRDGCEHKIGIRPMGGGFRGNFSRFSAKFSLSVRSSGPRSLGSGMPLERNRAASQTDHRGFAKEKSGRGERI